MSSDLALPGSGQPPTDTVVDNVLYDLPTTPDDALAAIENAYRGATDDASHENLLRDVDALLRDDIVGDDVRKRLRSVYSHQHAPGWARGPIGLFLAMDIVTRYAHGDDGGSEPLSAAGPYLHDASVTGSLRKVYQIDDSLIDLATATPHRVGTTSVILRVAVNREGAYRLESRHLALKLILPRYFTVKEIRRQTREYRSRFSLECDVVPQVHGSGDLWILMDFVNGRTLEEILMPEPSAGASPQDRAGIGARGITDPADLALVRKAFESVCRALAVLDRRGVVHGDLSPANIIVTNEKECQGTTRPFRVELVDFGVNYAVFGRLGSSAAHARADIYVAPELKGSPVATAWRADAYSLGVMLLEFTAGRRLRSDELEGQLARLWHGDDKGWSGAEGIARIVEELISPEPTHRLLLRPRDAYDESGGTATGGPYGYLERLMAQEAEVQASFDRRTGGRGYGLLGGWRLLTKPDSQIRNLRLAEASIKDPVDDTYARFSTLGIWAGVAILLWGVSLVVFAVFTLADLGLPTSGWIGWFVRLTHRPYVDWVAAAGGTGQVPVFDHFWENLPGRLVALTFALTNVTFYINIFSKLSLRALRTGLATSADVVLRAGIILLPAAVLWIMVWDPENWAIVCGIGCNIIVLGNYLSLKILERAVATVGGSAGEAGELPRGRLYSLVGDRAYRWMHESYSEWWTVMAFYTFGLLAIGIMSAVGVLHDGWLFALCVVLINVMKMYRINCTKLAPQAGGWLAWSVVTLRRAEAAAPPAAASPATMGG